MYVVPLVAFSSVPTTVEPARKSTRLIEAPPFELAVAEMSTPPVPSATTVPLDGFVSDTVGVDAILTETAADNTVELVLSVTWAVSD